MQKTYLAKKTDIKRAWYILDARDKILGRLAVQAAKILRGKHKPQFTPSVDCGDNVLIVNAASVRVTGRKLTQKVYRRFSGYPGGLREVYLGEMLKKNPAEVITLAVRRMLPGGPLGRDMLKKLKVYAQDKHPHSNAKPISWEMK
ncbi:50S ribosomal protein L13 [bacterium]|nr:MAG: 50S ribosomal protein L13 [bacterium]